MRTLFLLFISLNCFATNYYVKLTGSDAATGTSIAQAWQSFAKVNSFTFAAGDSILLRRGDTFYGTITLITNNITIGAYDVGANPIISGFATVSSWVNVGSNIWESASAVTTLNTCNMVVINGKNTPIGRTPNTGYYSIATHTLKTSLTSASLNSGINWTGAEAVIKTSDWTINRTTITSQAGNLINFDGAPLNYEIKDGYGFFLQKDIRTLDTLSEWYFNPTTKKLTVYSIGMPTNVKVATVENLFWINAVLSGITIKDIAFEGSNGSAIYRNRVFTIISNITIKNCSINFSGFSAIELKVNGILIDSNIINNSNDFSLQLNNSRALIVTNNIIRNSGTIAGMGVNNDNAFSSISFDGAITGSRNTVTNNTIINTGHNPITFGKDTTYIAYNILDSFNTVIDDGAAIYGYGASNPTITKNIVSNSIGAKEGTNRSYVFAHGIYLDDNTNNATVTHNTIFNIAGNGIVVHNAWSSNVSNNTVFNSGLSAIAIVGDLIGGPAGRIRNNIIKNNVFVAKETSQQTAEFSSVANDLDSTVGTIDSNIYARPLDDILSIKTREGSGGTLKNAFRDLINWKALYNKDANSKTSSKTFAANIVTNVLAGNKIANGLFTTNIGGVNLTTQAAGSSIIRDAAILDLGSLKVNALENIVFLINTTSIINTKQYILRFTATATVEVNLQVYIIGASAVQTIKIFPYRKNYEMVFSYPTTISNPTISFSTQSFPSTFWLDNIVFTEAVVTPVLSNSVFDFQFNATAAPVVYSFVGLSKIGVDGTVSNNSVTIPAYRSLVLLDNGAVAPAPTPTPTPTLQKIRILFKKAN